MQFDQSRIRIAAEHDQQEHVLRRPLHENAPVLALMQDVLEFRFPDEARNFERSEKRAGRQGGDVVLVRIRAYRFAGNDVASAIAEENGFRFDHRKQVEKNAFQFLTGFFG